MKNKMERVLEVQQDLYEVYIVNPPLYMLERMKEFFPGLPTKKPDIWEWTSYGFGPRPPQEFFEYYQDQLDWNMLSKYGHFGRVNVIVEDGDIRRTVAEFGVPARSFENKLNLDLVMITNSIRIQFMHEPEELLRKCGIAVSDQGRKLLDKKPKELVDPEDHDLKYIWKSVIKAVYEGLEQDVGKDHPEMNPEDVFHNIADELVRARMQVAPSSK